MRYVIKVCTADEYLIVKFSPMRAERTPDIKKASGWKCRECAEIVASEFCGVMVVDADVNEYQGLCCPFCDTPLLKHAVNNPLGLARVNVLRCPVCHLMGSKELWYKVKK